MDSTAFGLIALMAKDNLELAADHADNDEPDFAAHELDELAEKIQQLRDLLPSQSAAPLLNAVNPTEPDHAQAHDAHPGTPSQGPRRKAR